MFERRAFIETAHALIGAETRNLELHFAHSFIVQPVHLS